MGAEVIALFHHIEHACDCVACGVPIFLASDFIVSRKRNHKEFFCPNGHAQVWNGESDNERLKREAREAKETLDHERAWAIKQIDLRDRQIAAARGQITKIKNRVGNGVCPCCNRSFQNLMAHMKTKHPDYKDEK